MAQIDIEYAGRTYTVPWTDDNVERLKGVAQHVRDGRAEVFTVLGDGFALTIVVVTLVAVAAVWFLIPDLPLRIILTAMLVLAVPALVVVVLGRRH